MRCLLKESLIVLAIASAVVVAALVGVYLPQGRKLDSLRSQMAAETGRMQADAAKAAVVPVMIREVQALKSRYTNLDRRLPKQKELAGFLREIASNLAAEKLCNQSIEPGSPAKEELFHNLPIIMRFNGAYLSLASFLDRIDKMERLTRVQKLVIVPEPTAKDGEQTLKIELQMNIYFTET